MDYVQNSFTYNVASFLLVVDFLWNALGAASLWSAAVRLRGDEAVRGILGCSKYVWDSQRVIFRAHLKQLFRSSIPWRVSFCYGLFELKIPLRARESFLLSSNAFCRQQAVERLLRTARHVFNAPQI